MTASPIDRKREINGVLYLAAAVILAVAFYLPAGRSGWLGQLIVAGGRGLVGMAALALPVVFVYMAVDYLLEEHLRVTRQRYTFVLLLLIASAALMHVLTIDPADFRRLVLDDAGQAQAWQALVQLWKTGSAPEQILAPVQTDAAILPGGLLGGGLALSLQALAGPVGSVVLLGAMILTLIILIFNVSLTRAVTHTARVISHTGQKVDQAVRGGVTQMRQQRDSRASERPDPGLARGSEIDRKSYDLELKTGDARSGKAGQANSALAGHEINGHGSADGAATGQTVDILTSDHASQQFRKPTLLESLKKLFKPDEEEDGIHGLSEADLAVPDFLKTGDIAKPVASQPAKTVQTGIHQQSAFDLTVSGPGWINTPGAVASPMTDAESLDDESTDNVSTAALPAGIHRLDQTGASPVNAANRAAGARSASQPAANAHANPDAAARQALDGPLIDNGRGHWTDRTEDPAGAHVQVMKTGKTGQPGSQIGLVIPYLAPPLDLLREDIPLVNKTSSQTVTALGQKLEQTLNSFGIQATVVHVTTGPTITRFELSPGPGVKVSRIVSLADDIALNLAAMGVRIEAPIPGKSAIGIEIPNKETSPVLLRGLLESPEFQRSRSPLTAVLGRDIQGAPILCDLARMPHLLIAGATGSGKSVCINSILISILYRSSPEDVKMLMIDPKVVELSVYNGIKHLLSPVVTDPKKAANTLLWAVNEMVRRYGLFAEKSVRDINSYNASAAAHDAALYPGEVEEDDAERFEKLPLILLVIDELSDLMATTPTEVEDAIARLTAMARAAGIHLIIATQRPSVDVITGVIKANIPSRIAFAVASQVDSRTILDMGGAEKLLGKGDMLYYPQSSAKPIRGQGAFVTDSEVERILGYIKAQSAAEYDQSITDAIMLAPSGNSKERDSSEQDELLPQALGIVVEAGYASVSLLQRRMNVGYPRAARLIDRMQEAGYVGPFEGSKPRKVLITAAQFMELKAREGS